MSTNESNYSNVSEFLSKSLSIFQKHIDYTENFAAEFKRLSQIGKNLQSDCAQLDKTSLSRPLTNTTKALIETNRIVMNRLEEIKEGFSYPSLSELESAKHLLQNTINNEPIDKVQTLLNNPAISNEKSTPLNQLENEPDQTGMDLLMEDWNPEPQNSSQTDDSFFSFPSDDTWQIQKNPRKTTTNQKYKCDTCNIIFKYKSTLDLHISQHTERQQKTYSCTLCDKVFGQSGNLARHMKTHTGDKPFTCPVCSKACTTTSNLKDHMTVHTKEKPYKCSVCEKTFGQSSALTVHMRVHSGERPYKCTLCSKAYTASSGLTTHMTWDHRK